MCINLFKTEKLMVKVAYMKKATKPTIPWMTGKTVGSSS